MATKRNKATKPSKTARSPDQAERRPSPDRKVEGAVTGDDRITVVGIGASAGGLKALQAFFESLPEKTGLAYVVVTHLHPEHESHMADLLQGRTAMMVSQVLSRTLIEPDHVYVIPPNRNILVTDSHLDIAEFEEPHGHRTPIDDFFRSLAREHKNPAAIILSGSGTDGAVGIKSVKEIGGLLLVQDPQEAEYDGMPTAAIGTGIVDAVLPVRDLARKLLDYLNTKPRIPPSPDDLDEQALDSVKRILAHVHARTGHDFSQYKKSTVLRRIQRRMQLNRADTLEQYLAYLRANPSESSLMFNDILIGVTNFFRDRTPWEALEREVIPALFQAAGGRPIRVWSIGCATGEEAYSAGILLLERAAKVDNHYQMLVLASDLDDVSLTRAREGIYPSAIEADVSRERLERFFTRKGNHYQVRNELREMVLFANHSILRDPPFSHIDLVVCRNVLIYLERQVQRALLDIFHYSLRPGGFLFLGNAETAEAADDLFAPIDKSNRIFAAKEWPGPQPHLPQLPLAQGPPRRIRHHLPLGVGTGPRQGDEVNYEEQHRVSLEEHGPPSVLVGEDYLVHHVSDTAGRYLVQPKGGITTDLLKLVRSELQLELRTALFHAFDKGKATLTRPVFVQFNGEGHYVSLWVRPRTVGGSHERQALVVFVEDENANQPKEIAPSRAGLDTHTDVLVVQLEAEVSRLREQLQTTIEEYDSSNEEMRAGNEELQSVNEELRSATEELETSKEELQSVNEELQTVNHELKIKLEEISRAHSDLENLMASSDIATLFIDRELRIVRYTPPTAGVFNIMASDRGRSITHLTHRLVYGELAADAQRVLRDLTGVEREVRGEDDSWYLMRQRPYRTMEHKIDGVVITFTEITQLKRAEQKAVELAESLEARVDERTRELEQLNRGLVEARDMFSTLFDSNPVPTVLLRKSDARFIKVNPAFLNLYQLRNDEVIDHVPTDLGFKTPSLGTKERDELMARLEAEGSIVLDFEVELRRLREVKKTVVAHFQRVKIDNTEAVLVAFTDITERKRLEKQVSDVLEATPDAMLVVDENDSVSLVNPQTEVIFGYTRDELIGQPVQSLFSGRYDGAHFVRRAGFFREQAHKERGKAMRLFAVRKDGKEFPAEVSLSPLQTGERELVIAAVRDVSERVKAEQQIRGLALNLTTAEQQERHRISQVLHDDLQQRLFAVKTHLTFLEGGLRKSENQEMHGEFVDLGRQLDEAISVTRNLSTDMSPVILQGEGLPDALLWLSQQMHERYGLTVEVQNGDTHFALEKSLRVILFQAVREVLFNVVKHSGTAQATVSFVQQDGSLRIAVQDLGKGFDVARMQSGSTLLGLKRRLSLLGCQMDVVSHPGNGTTVTIDVKLDGEDA